MKVPFIDLKQRFIEEKEEILKAVEKVLESGSLVLTPELRELEEAVEKYTGAKHCIGLNSGTDALMMALWAEGIGKNDEVIHPVVSFVATTGAIVHVGAKPVFCDVNSDGLINIDEIESKITKNTKAIMPVHWAGKMCEMDKLISLAKHYNIKIIEDSAQAMGSYYKGKHGGLFGSAGAISCHPLKNFNAVGDGGLLLTNDDEIEKKVRLYRNHGTASRDNVVIYGVNSRLDVINAEILKFRLKKLKNIIDRRRINANLYRKMIVSNEVFIPSEKTNEGFIDSYVMFIVQAEKRDKLKLYLDECNIESLVYYGKPLHLHEAAKQFGNKVGDFPIAEKQCDMVLALPHHQHLTVDQISYVSEKINFFYKNLS